MTGLVTQPKPTPSKSKSKGSSKGSLPKGAFSYTEGSSPQLDSDFSFKNTVADDPADYDYDYDKARLKIRKWRT